MPANSKPIEVAAVDDRVGIHLPSLGMALVIMLVGSIYPLIFTRPDGTVNHGFAIAIFLTMSAGFVHGVGFVPVARLWRLLFSGWSCLAGLILAAWLYQGM
jgi:predicted membrane protein